MWTAKWWKQTVEWVLFAALSTLSGTWTATSILGESSWKLAGLSAAGAALAMFVKCLGSSLTGSPANPAIVEPQPVVRTVTVPVVPRRAVVRADVLPEDEKWTH